MTQELPEKKFVEEICDHCGQTTNYDVKLGKGDAMIVLAIYNAVRRLDRNHVHLTRDMECRQQDFGSYQAMVAAGRMTSNMSDNVLRAKYCGLIAQYEGGGTGEYLITPKGAAFLRNKPVERMPIVSKKTHKKDYYFMSGNPRKDFVTFGELMAKETPWWDLNDATLRKIEGLPAENKSQPALL